LLSARKLFAQIGALASALNYKAKSYASTRI
jgi:hypothetical protein